MTPTVPITVEYSVTPLGRTLADTVQALRIWSEQHIDEVLAARADYDAVPAGIVQPISAAAGH